MSSIRDTESDVAEFYKFLHNRESGIVTGTLLPKLIHPDSKRISTWYVIVPFLASAFLLLFGWLVYESDMLKIMVLLFILVGYIGLTALQLMEIYADRSSIIQMFKNPLALYTKSLIEDPGSDVQLATALKGFSTDSLCIAKVRLETDQRTISHRLGVTVGALDKIGVIPGLFSLYIAASSSNFERFAVIAAVGVFCIYLLSYKIYQVWPRLGLYINFIGLELEYREKDASK